jgi:ubiquitin thioesterase protein OTUB1
VLTALGFSYFDTLVRQGNKAHIQEERTRITSLKNMLIKVGGFNEFLFENMLKETTNLLTDLAELISTRPQRMTMLLLTHFNEPKISNAIIYYFQLLASSWLKGHSSLYENFIPRTLGIDEYRKNYLEIPNQEIDPLGMTILMDVLIKPAGFTVEITYLDCIEGAQITTRLIQAEVDNGVPKNPNSPVIHLLCRPDHYDILYQNSSELPLSSHHIRHRSPNLHVSLAHNMVSGPPCQTTMPSLREFYKTDCAALLSMPGFTVAPSLKSQEDSEFKS